MYYRICWCTLCLSVNVNKTPECDFQIINLLQKKLNFSKCATFNLAIFARDTAINDYLFHLHPFENLH